MIYLELAEFLKLIISLQVFDKFMKNFSVPDWVLHLLNGLITFMIVFLVDESDCLFKKIITSFTAVLCVKAVDNVCYYAQELLESKYID